MKNNILLCILALTFALSSCQDMDLYPKTDVSAPEYWKTGEDFKLAANKFYGYLLSFHGDNNLASYDMQADLANSYETFNIVSNGRWLPTETDGVWTDSYARLRQINILIERANELNTSDPEILRYRAEALFFRAYIYFNLVKRFGDVPLILKVLDINSPELTMPRTPRAQVEDAILSDLTEALRNLPTKETIKENKEKDGRITWGGAMAFKARAALFFGTWAQNHKTRKDFTDLLTIAKEAAWDVMSKGKYNLYYYPEDAAMSYRRLFIEDGDESNEVILVRKYGKGVAPGTTHPNYNNASHGFYGGVTKKMADMFLDKNGLPITHAKTVFKGYTTPQSEFEDRDPRMTQILQVPGHLYYYSDTDGKQKECPLKFQSNSTTRTGYRLWKYMTDLNVYHDCYYDAKVLRYAEVLLIYAEAVFELEGSISDEDLNVTVNLIRERAAMPMLTNKFVTDNGLDMREEIRRERTIELFSEASRYDDLRRWKTAEVEMPQPMLGVKWSLYEDENEDMKGKVKVDGNGFLIVEQDRRFNPNRDYLAPLPTKQINMTNGTLKQNPGW